MGKTPFARKHQGMDRQTASRVSAASQGEEREGTDCGPVRSKLDREKLTGVCVCGGVCGYVRYLRVCVGGRESKATNGGRE